MSSTQIDPDETLFSSCLCTRHIIISNGAEKRQLCAGSFFLLLLAPSEVWVDTVCAQYYNRIPSVNQCERSWPIEASTAKSERCGCVRGDGLELRILTTWIRSEVVELVQHR